MAHTHNYEHQPTEEGFDGLGTKEDSAISADLSFTVYYMIHDCEDRNCPVSRYRSWLFEKSSFDLCCYDVHPDEPAESMEAEFNDFKGPEDPVVVDFACRHCGRTQTLESDHIYTTEK